MAFLTTTRPRVPQPAPTLYQSPEAQEPTPLPVNMPDSGIRSASQTHPRTTGGTGGVPPPPTNTPDANETTQSAGGGPVLVEGVWVDPVTGKPLDPQPTGGGRQEDGSWVDPTANQNTQVYGTPGYDQAKLADLSHTSPKYLIARVQQQFDPRKVSTDPNEMARYIAALNALGIGTFAAEGSDKVRLTNPHKDFQLRDGAIIDHIRAVDGGDPTWRSGLGDASEAYGTGSNAASATNTNIQRSASPTGMTSGASASNASSYDPNKDPFGGNGVRLASGGWVPQGHPMANGALWQGGTPGQSGQTPASTQSNSQLMQQAIQELLNTPQDVDAQSLYSSPEAASFRLAASRGEDRQREQLATDAGYGGEGNFEGRVRQLGQARTDNEADFLGQMAVRQMEDNKQRLIQGIQFAQSNGQFDQAQKLQRDLAELNASIQRAQMAQQGRQFDLSLGFDYSQLEVMANQAATEALLNGG